MQENGPLGPVCDTNRCNFIKLKCSKKNCFAWMKEILLFSEIAGVILNAMTLVEDATPPMGASGQPVMTMSLSLRPLLTRSSHKRSNILIPEISFGIFSQNLL